MQLQLYQSNLVGISETVNSPAITIRTTSVSMEVPEPLDFLLPPCL